MANLATWPAVEEREEVEGRESECRKGRKNTASRKEKCRQG